jgi:hypothetical protein
MKRRDVIKNTALFFGYAVSTTALTQTFIACSKDAKLAWSPVFLSNNQAATIAEIAETILPKTKTPGAKELGVPQFIDKMLKDLLSKEEQKDFLAGLEKVDETCQNKFNTSFLACTPTQRIAILTQLDSESEKMPPSVWGIRLSAPSPTAFFRRLKELTLLGYFTSQAIGEKVLSFDPMPGGYIACMPLPAGMNAWNE